MTECTTRASETLTVDLNEKKPIRVLLVDDETGLNIAKQCLELEGPFQVDAATSVDEATEKMKREEYDAVVSEYRIPGKDGLQFLNELRASGNSIPFIIFTGKGGEEVAVRALNLGADQYLSKTDDPETAYSGLAQAIRSTVDREKAEQALRTSEEKFRNIVENSQDVIMLTRPDGVIAYLSPACSRVLEYEPAELVDRLPWIFHPDDLEKVKAANSEAMKGGKGSDFECRVITKTGKIRWISHSSSPIIANGKVKLILSVVRDITDRKKAEQEFIESQEKFAGLFKSNPEATVYTDPSMHILDINPRFTDVLGYTIEEVKGKRLIDIVVPKNLIEEGKMLDEKAAEGYVYHDTLRMKKDGSLIPVALSAAPISIQGRLVGYIGVYKDISELKSAEKKLAMMNEKLRVIGGLTRHDVRNKLSTVTGNAFLIKKKYEDHADIIDALKETEQACKEIVRIFDFARTYEMLGVEELTYIDLEKTIDNAVSLFSNSINVKVVNDCHGLTVLADSLLGQLFYNLIDNSLKYGQKITTIRVRYEKADQDKLKVFYEDDGVGIPVANKPLIFREGFSTGGSTGYGLCLIKKMMEVYGWTIQETGEPGKCVQFVIEMPRTNPNGKENYRIA
jgi:PAS domain S-box-containing protein